MLLLEISRSTKQKKFLIKERKKKWSRKLELEIMTAKDSRREIRLKKRKMKDRVENKDDNLYWQITQIYIQKTLKNLHQKPIQTS